MTTSCLNYTKVLFPIRRYADPFNYIFTDNKAGNPHLLCVKDDFYLIIT